MADFDNPAAHSLQNSRQHTNAHEDDGNMMAHTNQRLMPDPNSQSQAFHSASDSADVRMVSASSSMPSEVKDSLPLHMALVSFCGDYAIEASFPSFPPSVGKQRKYQNTLLSPNSRLLFCFVSWFEMEMNKLL
jgi:hypothetical protein